MFRNQDICYREKFYFSQDYDLYLNLLSSGKKIVNIDKPLILWRINENAVSFQYSEQQKMFAETASQMYSLRATGRDDEYRNFKSDITSKNVLKSTITTNKMLEAKLIILLQNARFKEASEIFHGQYAAIDSVGWLKKRAFSIFINFPISYKLYRRIIYKDKIH